MAEVASSARRPLYVVSGGFLSNLRLRRILDLAGWSVKPGVPGRGDWVGVWGRTNISRRGRFVAERTGARVLTVEDAWLRSLFPGRFGDPPTGLLLDKTGVHFDPSAPSDLETLLREHPLDQPGLLQEARDLIGQMRKRHLTKYAAVETEADCPPGDFVLVVDQVRDDASVLASGGTETTFRNMLTAALDENPGRIVLVKTHPETRMGARNGYLGDIPPQDRVRLERGNISPWLLLERASGIYTHSSGLGFEAVLAGHRPTVFGQPFYSGWGLSDDRAGALPRRGRNLLPEQLFAGAMMLYPTWYDPCRDRLCGLEHVILGLDADARAWRADRDGYVAEGMKLWKRPHMQRAFGRFRPVKFTAGASSTATSRKTLIWASSTTGDRTGILRVEDGVIRSRGLGAHLTPPLSLAVDDLGIYFDATRESRLDRLIAQSVDLDPWSVARAERLITLLVEAGLSKYNTGSEELPDTPRGHRILVPGQVEDDASIRLGCGTLRRNADLLARVRDENPDAVIVYKPHPDVLAGLRKGHIDERAIAPADVVCGNVSAHEALMACDAVWTMTSTIGFEALVRGKPVTCLGLPFYAGWGLTTDLMPAPRWRAPGPALAQLVHAVLIDYPRYTDPVSGRPCTAELAIDRLRDMPTRHGTHARGILARLQGLRATISAARYR